jgi:hypothetical protein
LKPPPGGIFAGLIAAAILLFAVHVFWLGAYIADDAAITFAYAKNLARGHGLVLNPGTDPVEGYSNFLWLLAVLPFCARGADPTAGVKALSLVLGAATLSLVALAGRQLVAESRDQSHAWMAALAAVGLAAFMPYAVWASAGMENVLYCLLLVAALWLYLRQAYVACAAMLVALSLTRFEGVAIAGLFALHRAGALAIDRKRPSRADVVAALAFLIPYGAYITWHWLHFHAIVPNTYIAKSPTLRGGGAATVWQTVTSGWDYALNQLVLPYRLAFVAPLAIVGLAGLRFRTMTLMALLLAGVSGLVLLTGGDFYPQFRLGTLFLPLWFLIVTEGTRRALCRVRWQTAAALLAIVPIVVTCQPSIGAAASWGPGPISMGGLKPITADRFVELAKGITKRPITVMESDIGNLAYFTDFAVVDLGGLANLEIARHGFHGAFFLHYVFEEMKPDIVHLRDRFAEIANIPIPLMERDYRRVEGQPVGPYADGWYVRRDRASDGARLEPETGRAFASSPAASGAADVLALVQQRCDHDANGCHADPALSRDAQSRADARRRESRFAEAFEWYAAAWQADRRNVVALRRREDMRLLASRGCSAPPPAPDNVRASVEGDAVILAWRSGPGMVTSFTVDVGSASGLSDRATFHAAATTFTAVHVASGTYYVRVRGENECGVSAASPELVVTKR